MKRLDLLIRIERDANKFGIIQDETRAAIESCRISTQSVELAKYKGRKLREARREKHNYWTLVDAVDKARDRIKRALSCGDRLDTPESLRLIESYHQAQTDAFLVESLITLEDHSIP